MMRSASNPYPLAEAHVPPVQAGDDHPELITAIIYHGTCNEPNADEMVFA
jgi:hypothetical protein